MDNLHGFVVSWLPSFLLISFHLVASEIKLKKFYTLLAIQVVNVTTMRYYTSSRAHFDVDCVLLLNSHFKITDLEHDPA